MTLEMIQHWRDAGQAGFEQSGWPHKKNDLWKYAPLKRLLKSIDATAPGATVHESSTHPAIIRFDGARWILNEQAVAHGIKAYSFAELLQTQHPLLATLLQQVSPMAQGCSAMNQQFAGEGWVLSVPPDTQCEVPLVVQCELSGTESLTRYVRHWLLIGAGARGASEEYYSASPSSSSEWNIHTQVCLEKGAQWRHARVHEYTHDHVVLSRTEVFQKEHSHFRWLQSTRGMGWIRQELSVVLEGEGSGIAFDAIGDVHGKGCHEHLIHADHQASHTESVIRTRGLARDESMGHFFACAHVPKEVVYIKAHQSLKNRLLSPTARINARPQLEVASDEVQCTHGATVGQVDPLQQWYLQSRGLSAQEADDLLARAFIQEILRDYPNLQHPLFLSEE